MIATDPAKIPDDIKHKLLLMRVAFAAGDLGEAHHWLYAIACPSFMCLDPWSALEGRQCTCDRLPHPLVVDPIPSVDKLTDALERRTPP